MERIQLRRDTSTRWREVNPILMEGEVGFETDTRLRKIGDGVNRWNDLEYLAAENIVHDFGNSSTATISQDFLTDWLTSSSMMNNNGITNQVIVIKDPMEIIPRYIPNNKIWNDIAIEWTCSEEVINGEIFLTGHNDTLRTISGKHGFATYHKDTIGVTTFGLSVRGVPIGSTFTLSVFNVSNISGVKVFTPGLEDKCTDIGTYVPKVNVYEYNDARLLEVSWSYNDPSKGISQTLYGTRNDTNGTFIRERKGTLNEDGTYTFSDWQESYVNTGIKKGVYSHASTYSIMDKQPAHTILKVYLKCPTINERVRLSCNNAVYFEIDEVRQGVTKYVNVYTYESVIRLVHTNPISNLEFVITSLYGITGFYGTYKDSDVDMNTLPKFCDNSMYPNGIFLKEIKGDENYLSMVWKSGGGIDGKGSKQIKIDQLHNSCVDSIYQYGILQHDGNRSYSSPIENIINKNWIKPYTYEWISKNGDFLSVAGYFPIMAGDKYKIVVEVDELLGGELIVTVGSNSGKRFFDHDFIDNKAECYYTVENNYVTTSMHMYCDGCKEGVKIKVALYNISYRYKTLSCNAVCVPYQGQKIKLNTGYYNIVLTKVSYIKWQDNNNYSYAQGMAFYDNIMVKLSMNGYCSVYDVTYMDDPKIINQFKLDSFNDPENHGSACQFDETAIIGDYPVLYVSWGMSQGIITVEQFSLTGTKVLQTITINMTEFLPYVKHCSLIDESTMLLYGIDKSSPDAPTYNRYAFIKVRKPSISEGDVILTDADIIESGKVYWDDKRTLQSGFYCDGKLLALHGLSDYLCSPTTRGIQVIDINQKATVADINLSNYIEDEPESLSIKDGQLYMMTNTTRGANIIYRLDF